MGWIAFALMTVVAWGLYGGLLNWGSQGFEHNRIKAFLFVRGAYLPTALLLPPICLVVRGDKMDFFDKPDGVKWSLIAGVMGSLGAFTVLFALSNHPLTAAKQPQVAASVVMAVVFAGAPIVAALFGILTRTAKTDLKLPPLFIFVLFLSPPGGSLVSLFTASSN